MRSLPKHRQIYEWLEQQIQSGRFADGRAIPSEVALAKKFGSSRPTVARALRELQFKGVLDRRVGSGTFVRQPSAASGKTLGLLVPGLGNTEILDPICTEITRCAQSAGFFVLFGDSGALSTGVEHAGQICDSYIQRKVSGVFFAPIEAPEQRADANARVMHVLANAGIPVVLLDRDVVEFPDRSNADLVGIDDFRAAMCLANHLIDAGARRISFLARPHYPSTTDLRSAGVREALARRGLTLCGEEIASGDPADIVFVRSFLKSARPDAIVCANDRTAAILMQTLASLQIHIPRDIRIAGFDDVKYATLLSVPLTTMRQPCRAIARAAVKAMQERISELDLPGRTILLQAELAIRQSTGTPESRSVPRA